MKQLSPVHFNLLPRLKSLPLSNSRWIALAIVLLFTSFFATSTPAQLMGANMVAANFMTAPIETEPIYSIERRVFDRVNDERIRNGRKGLQWADQAAAVARFHSTEMVDQRFFGHEDRQGRSPSMRADMLGLRDWREIGENIAWLSGAVDPVQRVVANWMHSPSHRKNILDPGYRESGVGLAMTRDGKYYFTQVFLRRR
jgi:uncharacterized protein YkwD